MSAEKYSRDKSPSEWATEKGISRQLAYSRMEPRVRPEFWPSGILKSESLLRIRKWKIETNFHVYDLIRYCEECCGCKLRRSESKHGRAFELKPITRDFEAIASALLKNEQVKKRLWIYSDSKGVHKFWTRVRDD